MIIFKKDCIKAAFLYKCKKVILSSESVDDEGSSYSKESYCVWKQVWKDWNFMGMIHTRKRGKYWEYSFETASVKEQRRRVCKSGFRTKSDALAAGTKAQSEYNEAGLYFTPSEISFSDYLDFWMEGYCMFNLKDFTIRSYQKRIDYHIRPELGMYKLKALTPIVLQQFINRKATQRYSRNTLDTLKSILSGCLKYAVKQEMICYSPMANVTLPSLRN